MTAYIRNTGSSAIVVQSPDRFKGSYHPNSPPLTLRVGEMFKAFSQAGASMVHELKKPGQYTLGNRRLCCGNALKANWQPLPQPKSSSSPSWFDSLIVNFGGSGKRR